MATTRPTGQITFQYFVILGEEPLKRHPVCLAANVIFTDLVSFLDNQRICEMSNDISEVLSHPVPLLLSPESAIIQCFVPPPYISPGMGRRFTRLIMILISSFSAKLIVGLPPRLTSFRIVSSGSVCSANNISAKERNFLAKELFLTLLGPF